MVNMANQMMAHPFNGILNLKNNEVALFVYMYSGEWL